MKNLFYFLFVLLVSCDVNYQYQETKTAINADDKNLNIPENVIIEEDVISIGTDFTLLSSDGKHLGSIEEEVLNFTATFKLLNNSGNMICYSKQELISFGTKINIIDNDNKLMGKINENVFKSFSVYTQYDILDIYDKKIAKSDKEELLSTTFNIYDNNNNIICVIHRPMINVFSDKWVITFHTDDQNLRRMLLFIPCYKTFRDNSKED